VAGRSGLHGIVCSVPAADGVNVFPEPEGAHAGRPERFGQAVVERRRSLPEV